MEEQAAYPARREFQGSPYPPEDKAEAIKRLEYLLQTPGSRYEGIQMHYAAVGGAETVHIRYPHGEGCAKVNVTLDSIVAMCRDVLRCL